MVTANDFLLVAYNRSIVQANVAPVAWTVNGVPSGIALPLLIAPSTVEYNVPAITINFGDTLVIPSGTPGITTPAGGVLLPATLSLQA
jgi:hypothetical protein